MKKLYGVIAAAGLAAGGLALAPPAQGATPAAATASQEQAYTPPPIDFGTCASATLQRYGAECGFVTVPLDYANPGGEKIKLAVSRVKHKTPDSQYQGITLVNPGGPGGSGLVYSIFQSFVPNGAGLSYDWIGFDPRGVGSSQPSLSCDGNYIGFDRPYYVPVTDGLEQRWRKKAKDYAAACGKAGGALLDHMKTTDSAADMDSIRKALGEKQINYYGFSYGTYLGSVYATLYPDKVRRFVFDGVVDPTRVWEQANYDQDVAFDKNIKIYFDWIAKYDSVYHLGTDGAAIEALYYSELKALRAQPAVNGTIGPDEWTDVFQSAAYYVYGWEDVASAFSAAVNQKDFTGIADLYGNPTGPGADNGYAVYLAVQCTDARWTTNFDKVRAQNWAIYKDHPFLTWGNAWFNAPCLTWPAKPGTPVTVDGSKAPPILLISETNDAATPFSGALEVRQLFPKSVLIEGVGGTTHAGSLSGVTCTDNKIARYFATGALPDRKPGNRSDVQCDPVPQPDPTADATAAAASSSGGSSLAGTPVARLRLGAALK